MWYLIGKHLEVLVTILCVAGICAVPVLLMYLD